MINTKNEHKTTFIIKPYDVGRNKGSLAFIVPYVIVRKYNLSSSRTVFCLKDDEMTKTLILKPIDDLLLNENEIRNALKNMLLNKCAAGQVEIV